MKEYYDKELSYRQNFIDRQHKELSTQRWQKVCRRFSPIRPRNHTVIYTAVALGMLLCAAAAIPPVNTRVIRRRDRQPRDVLPVSYANTSTVVPISHAAACLYTDIFRTFGKGINFPENKKRDKRLHYLLTLAEKNPESAVQQDSHNDLLCTAALSGKSEIVKILIEEGKADIHLPGLTGITPLSLAFLSKDIPTIKLLLDKGADIYQEEKDGIMPVHYLLSNEKYHFLLDRYPQFLHEERYYEANVLLWYAIDRRLDKALDFLIERVDIHRLSQYQHKTALHFACQLGNVYAVKALTKAGSDIYWLSEKNLGAIHYTLVKFGQKTEAEMMEIIKILLAKDWALAYEKSPSGKNLYDYAKERHWQTLINFLQREKTVKENKNDPSEKSIYYFFMLMALSVFALVMFFYQRWKKNGEPQKSKTPPLAKEKNILKNKPSEEKPLQEKVKITDPVVLEEKTKKLSQYIDKAKAQMKEYNSFLDDCQDSVQKSVKYNKNAKKIAEMKFLDFPFKETISLQELKEVMDACETRKKALEEMYISYRNWRYSDKDKDKVKKSKSHTRVEKKTYLKEKKLFPPVILQEEAPVNVSPKAALSVTLSQQGIFRMPSKSCQVGIDTYLALLACFNKKGCNFNIEIERNIYKLALSYYICRIFNAWHEMFNNAPIQEHEAIKQFRWLRNSMVKCISWIEYEVLIDGAALMIDLLSPLHQEKNIHPEEPEKLILFCKKVLKSEFGKSLITAWQRYKNEQKSQSLRESAKTRLFSCLKEIQAILRGIDVQQQSDFIPAIKMLVMMSAQIYKDYFNEENETSAPIRELFYHLRKNRNRIAHDAYDYHEVREEELFRLSSRLPHFS